MKRLTGAQSRGVETWAWVRVAILVAIVAAEYVVIALTYDGLMQRFEGPWQRLTDLVTFSALGATGALVLYTRQLRAALSEALPEVPPRFGRSPALFIHLALYATVYLTARAMMAPGIRYEDFALGAAVFLVSGLLSVLALAPLIIPLPALVPLLRRLRVPILVGLAAGVLAFLVGFLASFLWTGLATSTLLLTALTLLLFSSDVGVLPEEHLLAVEGFTVHVAKECSGLEGMGLIAVFLSLFLWSARARLRFPRALVVLPLGVGIMYLSNLLRLVALVMIGARLSPAVALGGFHSKAGWVFFSVVALSLVAVVSRSTWITTDGVPMKAAGRGEGVNEVAAYLVPMLATIATSMLGSLFLSGSFDAFYGVRVLVVMFVLYRYRGALLDNPRAVTWGGPAAGLLAFAIWMWLTPVPSPEDNAGLASSLAALPPIARYPWLVVRILGAVVTVPIAEELAFRGFIMRRVVSEDFTRVPLSRVTWLGLALSSLAFGALHSAYIAGTAVGLLYGLCMWRRGSLLDAMVAHGVTNGLLAAYVLATGRYGYW